jgi:hypothetical protein
MSWISRQYSPKKPAANKKRLPRTIRGTRQRCNVSRRTKQTLFLLSSPCRSVTSCQKRNGLLDVALRVFGISVHQGTWRYEMQDMFAQ